MSNDDVMFQVNIRSLLVDAEGLAELTRLLKSKQFLSRDYKGKGNGFNGHEYDYKLVSCEYDSQVEIRPLPDNLWLFLNTFGKETK